MTSTAAIPRHVDNNKQNLVWLFGTGLANVNYSKYSDFQLPVAYSTRETPWV